MVVVQPLEGEGVQVRSKKLYCTFPGLSNGKVMDLLYAFTIAVLYPRGPLSIIPRGSFQLSAVAVAVGVFAVSILEII